MKSITGQWEEFAAMCIPSNAGEVQRREMKRAFFAGAWIMLETTSAIAALPEGEAEVLLSRVSEEIKRVLLSFGAPNER